MGGAGDGKEVEQSCTFDIIFNNLVDYKRILLLSKKCDLGTGETPLSLKDVSSCPSDILKSIPKRYEF